MVLVDDKTGGRITMAGKTNTSFGDAPANAADQLIQCTVQAPYTKESLLNATFLFDLSADPHELHDVKEERPDDFKRMENWKKQRKCQKRCGLGGDRRRGGQKKCGRGGGEQRRCSQEGGR